MNSPAFRIEPVEYSTALEQLRAVRETVFVHEQGVPVELEWDELDPQCHHLLARDAAGQPIGTGRLTPEHRIGRMAVLAEWRGRGVGEALLDALIERARELRWHEISLHAQTSAIEFYARRGFLPLGERFMEAGIEHQSMHRLLDQPTPVETHAQALAAVVGIVATARRRVHIYSRELDPGLLDQPEALAAFRRLGTRGGEVQVLLQDPLTPQRALAPVIGLSQRLPSAFRFRAIDDPVDQEFPSAYVVNDLGGWYFRSLGHRIDGETQIDGAGRARQLRSSFEPVWERSRLCSEFRALGI